jgi:hypothetical protein
LKGFETHSNPIFYKKKALQDLTFARLLIFTLYISVLRFRETQRDKS